MVCVILYGMSVARQTHLLGPACPAQSAPQGRLAMSICLANTEGAVVRETGRESGIRRAQGADRVQRIRKRAGNNEKGARRTSTIKTPRSPHLTNRMGNSTLPRQGFNQLNSMHHGFLATKRRSNSIASTQAFLNLNPHGPPIHAGQRGLLPITGLS